MVRSACNVRVRVLEDLATGVLQLVAALRVDLTLVRR
jgi:hypothetical protein